MTPLTTKAAEIRAGLVADWRKAMEGVPEGPWTHEPWHISEGPPMVYVKEGWLLCALPADDHARWIARCSPAGISDLLALIEQQTAELAEARANLAAQIVGHRHSAKEATTLLIERKDRAKERDRIVAAGEDLAAALRRYGFPMSEEAWRNTGDDAPANSQASVEARALHRAAAAFFREISGAHHE